MALNVGVTGMHSSSRISWFEAPPSSNPSTNQLEYVGEKLEVTFDLSCNPIGNKKIS